MSRIKFVVFFVMGAAVFFLQPTRFYISHPTLYETEKRKINYIINYNKSKNSSVFIDSLDASKLTGRFAEFEVTLQGSQLMFRDTNQRNINLKK